MIFEMGELGSMIIVRRLYSFKDWKIKLTHSPISCLFASTGVGRSFSAGAEIECPWTGCSISESSISISSPENPKLNAIFVDCAT